MKETAYFCPKCDSPCTQRSVLAGGSASCDKCQWKGSSDDLRAVPFEHNFLSSEAAVRAFVSQLSAVVGQDLTLPLARLLIKWGFFTLAETEGHLPHYLRAVAQATATAVVETRRQLETGELKPRKSSKKGVN